MNIGAIVGRFQIDELHQSHIDFINSVYDSGVNQVVFLLGVPALVGTKRDPIPYDLRAKMIQVAFPDATVMPIFDMESDDDWSAQVDFLLSKTFPGSKIKLFCSRDGFKPFYKGKFEVIIKESLNSKESSSQTRSFIKDNPINHQLFRAGIIWATENAWEYSRPAVDIAVVRDSTILLGRKEKERYWRLPGGMVDQEDGSYEETARRELHEETGLIIEGSLVSLGSFKVNDWRAKKANVSIHTTLFFGQYTFGKEMAADDLVELEWFDLNNIDPNKIMPGHRALISAVQIAVKNLTGWF
jgi:8-oxo-dGTP pyrophosphatase MutT (NUDIX family)